MTSTTIEFSSPNEGDACTLGILFLHHNVNEVVINNLESIRRSNPDATLVTMSAGEILDGGYCLDATPEFKKFHANDPQRSSDWLLCSWFRQRNERCDKWWIVEWDVFCTVSVRDYYKPVWEYPLVASSICLLSREPGWYWFRHIAEMPENYRSFAMAGVPFLYLLDDAALRSICNLYIREPITAGNGEMRFATVANRCGYAPCAFSPPNDQITWMKVQPGMDRPGIFHAVKNLVTPPEHSFNMTTINHHCSHEQKRHKNRLGILFLHHNSDEVVLNNLDSIRRHNPNATIITMSSGEPLPGGYSLHGTPNIEGMLTNGIEGMGDWLVCSWFLQKIESCDKWWVVEWDTYCTISVETYYKSVWSFPFIASQVFLRHRETEWYWFRFVGDMPGEYRAHATGTTPFLYLVDESALHHICRLLIKEPMFAGNSGLRFPTVARRCGFAPCGFSPPNDRITWKEVRPELEQEAIFHSVRYLVSSSD